MMQGRDIGERVRKDLRKCSGMESRGSVGEGFFTRGGGFFTRSSSYSSLFCSYKKRCIELIGEDQEVPI